MLKTYSNSLDYLLLGLMAQKAGKTKTAAGYFVKAADEGDLDETMDALDQANQDAVDCDPVADEAPELDQGIETEQEEMARALAIASRNRFVKTKIKAEVPALDDLVNTNSDSYDLRTTDAVDGSEIPTVEEVMARVARAKRNAAALARRK